MHIMCKANGFKHLITDRATVCLYICLVVDTYGSKNINRTVIHKLYIYWHMGYDKQQAENWHYIYTYVYVLYI